MVKKSKSRLDQYRSILNEKGKTLEECDVLAFSFPNDSGPGIFHFELMCRSYPQYFIFDSSDRTAVSFFLNGGINILVMAMQDGEYWFSIGHGYKNAKTAKRAAVKEFAKHGYTFDAKEMEKLVIE